MAEDIVQPPKRIFIIGPMSEGVFDEDTIELSEHIPNIARAVEVVYRQLTARNDLNLPDVQIHEPPDAPGDDIPRGVFSFIMHCDFAIADISTASPNVMYELAMLHANGVPVILLARDGDQVFYLNQNNCLSLDNFKSETVEAALAGRSFDDTPRPGPLEQLLTVGQAKTFWNPITKHFGGVHMINVAAATGVATGNFYNFTGWVLREGGIFRQIPELIDLVLIRPGRIKDVDRAVGLLDKKFEVPKRDKDKKSMTDKDGNPIKAVPEEEFIEPGHPRGKYFVKRVGNHLVDYPTPISSLQSSRQYREIGRFLQDHSDGLDDTLLPPFEKRMIDIYFDTLRDLATSGYNNCDWGRVKILTIEDALEYLGS